MRRADPELIRQDEAGRPTASGLAVLLVAEEGARRKELASILGRRGHDVTVCAMPGAAAACAGRCFPLIVVDATAADAEGRETCRRLRASSSSERSVIVALVADASPATTEAILDAGASDWIVASVDPSLLEARLRVAERQAALALAAPDAAGNRRYRHLVEHSQCLICTHDLDGVLLTVNAAGAQALGYEPAELIGTNIRQLIAPVARPLFDLYLARMRRKPTHRGLMRVVSKSGEERFWVYQNARYDEPGQAPYVLGHAQDVTDLKRAEATLREGQRRAQTLLTAAARQAQERELLDRVRAALARELELPALFRAVVEAIAATFGYTQVSLYRREAATLVLQHQVGYDRVIPRIRLTEGISGRVARTGVPVLLADVRTDPAFLGAIAGIVSEVCVPFHDGEAVAGTLNVESRAGVRLGADDLRLLVALSEHLSLAVGRARLYATVRQSEERLRLALASAAMGTWDWHVPTGQVRWSAEIGPLYGLPPGTPGITAAEWYRLVHPEDRERLARADTRVIERGADYEEEFRVVRPDGAIRWLVAKGRAVERDAQGRGVQILGVTMDVTAGKRAEEQRLQLVRAQAARVEAEAAERRITDVLERITDAFVAVDPGWRFTYVNQHAADLLRRSPADMLGRTLWEVFPEAVGSALDERLREAARSQTAVDFDAFYPPLGVWVAVHAYPATEGLSIYLQDVTARKQAEENLRFLAEAGSLLVASLDVQTTLTNLARLAVPYLGDWCIVDLVDEQGGVEPVAFAHLDAATEERLAEMRRRYPLNKGASRGPGRVLATGVAELVPTIDEAWLDAVARDPDHLALLRALGLRSSVIVPLVARGTTLGVVSFGATKAGRFGANELALAEELARRAALAVDNARLYQEAQAAVRARDQFLSVAAHELRTPITTVKGFAELLSQTQPPGELERERFKRSIQRIVEASERLALLTDDLLDVSRLRLGQLALRRQPVVLADLVGAVALRYREQAGDRNGWTVELPDGPCVAEVDPARLEQVLTNLLDNAVKYTPNGGPIRVALTCAANEAELTVTDAGIGLPAGATERIFEPFGRAVNAVQASVPGLGLGLYICRSIIERHGGRIWAESAGEGRGTTLRLRLPTVEPEETTRGA